jgi:hypothetical protein
LYEEVWKFIEQLAYADLKGYQGFNIFSLTTFTLMFVYGLYKFYKANSPFEIKKIPLIIMISITTLTLYYTLLDRISGITFAFYKFLIYDCSWLDQLIFEFLIFLNFPFNTIWLTFPLAYFYAIKPKLINSKRLALILSIQILWILATLFIFGDWNMRNMSGDKRTIFYITNFIPMWIFWLFGYIKIFKKGKVEDYVR